MTVERDCPLPAVVDESMFALAPVSLWLEDGSGVKRLFETWAAAGMTSLRDWLGSPDHMRACLGALKILKVNPKTLSLFEAADFKDFIANLPKIITKESWECLIDQLDQLWNGQTTFAGKTINTTLKGRVLDVQIRGSLLPGHERDWSRLLVSIEDVTELENARRAAAESEAYARGLFQHSPAGLWVKDFSAVKRLLDTIRGEGVADLAAYFGTDPSFAQRCVDAVQVLNFNQQALNLFGATDRDRFVDRLQAARCQLYRAQLQREIVGLWEGKLFQQWECLGRTFDERAIHFHSQLSVLPGHEDDWAKVQIAKFDISTRKQAEARLRYVGLHDALTQLHNRTFFAEKIAELDASAPSPVTVIMIDLNGLKRVNDLFGHAAGDDMLRAVGHLLRRIVEEPICVARVGGDEFVMIMPNADEEDGQAMVRRLEQVVDHHNDSTPDCRLSFSMGAATRCGHERMEAVVTRADKAMYASKARFYAGRRNDDHHYIDGGLANAAFFPH